MAKNCEQIHHRRETRMANKHARKHSTSLVIREIRIKTTMKYHYTPTGVTKIKKTDPLECPQRRGAIGNLTLLVEMENRTTTLEKSLVVSHKGKYSPTQRSSNPTEAGIYPREIKTYTYIKTCPSFCPPLLPLFPSLPLLQLHWPSVS